MNPVIPALAAVFGASYGFMLPVSTPPNAIVYGSGMIPITKMIRSGVVFDLIGIVLITLGITVMARRSCGLRVRPGLVLGPLLRYTGESEATVWVETDTACEVEVLGHTATHLRDRGPPLRPGDGSQT